MLNRGIDKTPTLWYTDTRSKKNRRTDMKSVIEVYSDIANKNPKWTPDEERDFIKSCVTKTGKWRNKTRFVNEAFKHNLGLVFSIVQKTAFAKTDDVVQKGVIALVESLKQYDPSRNIKISTWVSNPIRWAVLHHQHTYSHDKLISEEFSSLNQRYNLHLRLVSIDANIGKGEEDSDTFGNVISSSDVHPDYANMRGLSDDDENARKVDIKEGIAALVGEMGKFLTPREIKVVNFLIAGKNNVEIAKEMKVTRMRVGQMIKKIFEKIRNSKVGKKLKGIFE